MKYERPDKLNSVTYKYHIACGSIYVTISYDKDKIPRESFIEGGKGGGCRANQEALGRLTSALLRNDLYEDARHQLRGIPCVACARVKGSLQTKEEKENYPSSCADAVARGLEDYVKSNDIIISKK